jgi:hypothetical protein
MWTVLDHISSSDNDRNAGFDCVVTGRSEVDVLTQHDYALDASSAKTNLFNITGDTNIACPINHLLLDGAAGLPVQLPQQDVAARIRKDLGPVSIILLVGPSQEALIGRSSESQANMNLIDDEAKTSKSAADAHHAGAESKTADIAHLMPDVTAVDHYSDSVDHCCHLPGQTSTQHVGHAVEPVRPLCRSPPRGGRSQWSDSRWLASTQSVTGLP